MEPEREYISIKEYIDIRLAANQIAIEKAEQAIQYRLEGLNEFRQSLSDQTRQYVTKDELNAIRDAQAAEIKSLQKIVNIGIGALATLQFLLKFLVFP